MFKRFIRPIVGLFTGPNNALTSLSIVNRHDSLRLVQSVADQPSRIKPVPDRTSRWNDRDYCPSSHASCRKSLGQETTSLQIKVGDFHLGEFGKQLRRECHSQLTNSMMTATSVPVGFHRDQHLHSSRFARSALRLGRAPGRCFPRVLVTLLVIPLLLLALGCKPVSQKVRFPSRVLVEDFQTPLDRDLSDLLLRVDRSKTGRLFGQQIMKAVYDDVNVAELTLGAVELRPGQFPNRPELGPLVDECARILQMPKPRVFIVDSPGLGASSVGYEKPVILLPSRTLKSFTDPAELRFIVGREMGHIRCGHAKWQPVLQRIVGELGGLKAIPDRFAAVPLLPLLKWSREAEMSADNAGLICSQNPKAAERVLAAMLLGARDFSIGEIDVDSLLKQRNDMENSQFSELMLLCREAMRQQPFVPDRIAQLRCFAASSRYLNLWK